MHKKVDKCTQYGIMIVIVTFMCEKLVCVFFLKKSFAVCLTYKSNSSL